MQRNDVKARIEAYIEKTIKTGTSAGFTSSPDVKAYATTWQIILPAETFNNVSRYEG